MKLSRVDERALRAAGATENEVAVVRAIVAAYSPMAFVRGFVFGAAITLAIVWLIR